MSELAIMDLSTSLLSQVGGTDLDHARIDSLESFMLAGIDSGSLTAIDMPVMHRFTAHTYAREIFMPAGTVLTSRIHNTDHFYAVLSGSAEVFIPGSASVLVEAGHIGITRAGTRRVLRIIADCQWVTFHPVLPEEDAELDEAARIEMIGRRIITRRELLPGSTANELFQERLLPQLATTPRTEDA